MKTKNKKVFNLKIAQQNYQQIENIEDPNDMQDIDLGQEGGLENNNEDNIVDTYEDSLNFQDGGDLQSWLQQRDNIVARNELLAYVADDEAQQQVDDLLDDYYQGNLDNNEKLNIAVKLFEILPDNLKAFDVNDEGRILAPYVESSVKESNKVIKDIAKKIIAKQNKNEKVSKSSQQKGFNLKKFAQHKNQENVVMWNSDQVRIDPFYRMPVSDWHIFERNKGWGQNIGDRWDIDYEVIWRKYIMDKYSRPYRDSDGNWVGGYIEKRFETDKNIPETSNYQLKPGQKRKPFMPEYSLTEARMEDAREKGEIEGKPICEGKPFNWKEASSKKKS